MSSDTGPATPALAVEELVAGYGGVIALDRVSISAGTAAITAVLGANGAGKTTLLRAVSGMIRPRRGRVRLDGTDLTGRNPEQMVRAGIAHVPEGQAVIPELTVEENLRIGMMSWPRGRSRADRSAALDEAFERFPPLAARRRKLAAALSGGERQMLAFGMALMLRPKLLLIDEPSIGLAPMLVAQIFDAIMRIRDEFGTAVLIVEQQAQQILRIADEVFVIRAGRLISQGPVENYRGEDALRHVYLSEHKTEQQEGSRP